MDLKDAGDICGHLLVDIIIVRPRITVLHANAPSSSAHVVYIPIFIGQDYYSRGIVLSYTART